MTQQQFPLHRDRWLRAKLSDCYTRINEEFLRVMILNADEHSVYKCSLNQTVTHLMKSVEVFWAPYLDNVVVFQMQK